MCCGLLGGSLLERAGLHGRGVAHWRVECACCEAARLTPPSPPPPLLPGAAQVLDTIWERNSYEGRYRRPLVSELSQMFSDIYGAFLRGPRGKARKGRGLKYEELSEAECAACQRLRNIFDQMQCAARPHPPLDPPPLHPHTSPTQGLCIPRRH